MGLVAWCGAVAAYTAFCTGCACRPEDPDMTQGSAAAVGQRQLPAFWWYNDVTGERTWQAPVIQSWRQVSEDI
jgi:hypothetical protein